MTKEQNRPLATYLNPVYNQSAPDPFVLKYCGEYWAYCTDMDDEGTRFVILRSSDLVHWQNVGCAMEPLPGDFSCYWAPEVTYWNGRFYMYYSVGDETNMEIRVAAAEVPAGPFVDSGHRLTTEQFAIDAHVFIDDDLQWYLFYATDFMTHSHVGTGTMRDRMLDPFTLAGEPVPVTRALYDWQVYDPERKEKGGVRWHTVEGPFVLKRKVRYYQMFSGGNWQNVTYGVSYAMSASIAAPGEWQQVADGEQVLPILRTIPGEVIGPGHNSAVRGTDNQQLWCVYHRWNTDIQARVLAVDPLDWVGERMIVLGPSTTPQPAPLLPTISGFGRKGLTGEFDPVWEQVRGEWSLREGALWQEKQDESAEMHCKVLTAAFTVEVSIQLTQEVVGPGTYGLSLHAMDGVALRCVIVPERRVLRVAWQQDGTWNEQDLVLPLDFDVHAFHLIRLVVDGTRVWVKLDDVVARWYGDIAAVSAYVGLTTDEIAASFAGFALTVGWEDLFEVPGMPYAYGWRSEHPSAWSIRDLHLVSEPSAEQAMIVKSHLLKDYTLIVNAQLIVATAADGCYGFYPLYHSDAAGPLLTIRQQGEGWILHSDEGGPIQAFPLPSSFEPTQHQQFRLRKQNGRLVIHLEAQELGGIAAPNSRTGVALYAHHAQAAFDMVRVTAITTEA